MFTGDLGMLYGFCEIDTVDTILILVTFWTPFVMCVFCVHKVIKDLLFFFLCSFSITDQTFKPTGVSMMKHIH